MDTSVAVSIASSIDGNIVGISEYRDMPIFRADYLRGSIEELLDGSRQSYTIFDQDYLRGSIS